MNAKLVILNDTIKPPIRPYPTSNPIMTELHRALLSTPSQQEIDFYQFQQMQGKLAPHAQGLTIQHGDKLITLPSDITTKLIEYLKSPKYGEPFDCHRFVSYITQKPLSVMQYNGIYDPETAQPGDTGIILNRSCDVIHRQIYLDNDLFFSKGGNLGPLVISTNDEMIKLRGGHQTLIQSH